MKKYSLMIDTSTDYFYCACLDEKTNEQKWATKTVNSVESCNQNLMHAMMQNKTNFNEIEKIYFTTGPGSFTSVRIGGVIARTLCNIFKCQLYVIESLRLQVLEKEQFISIISTSKTRKNVAVYDNGKKIYETKTNNLNNELASLLHNFPKAKTIIDYRDIDLFDYFKKNLNAYQLVTNWNELKLVY